MEKYPSKSECYEIQKKFHMPENIKEHCKQVSDVAVFLAKKLNEKGLEVDVELLRSAGLLHDIARPIDFGDITKSYIPPTNEQIIAWQKLKDDYPNKFHHEVGFEIFKNDYPILAKIIRKHVHKAIIYDKPETWEEKILNYADKRVAHKNIVTLKEREEEGRKRWFSEHPNNVDNNIKELNEIHEMNLEFETELFDLIGIKPDGLKIELKKMKGSDK
jgi:putative nucleotidyltransferase with HDIG domain